MLNRLRTRLRGVPGLPQARHVAEKAIAPYLRADLHAVNLDLIAHRAAHGAFVDETRVRLDVIEGSQPVVLNAISSTNGTSRLLRREVDAVRDDVAAMRGRVDALELASPENDEGGHDAVDDLHALQAEVAQLRELVHGFSRLPSPGLARQEVNGLAELENQVRGHADTQQWLIGRVETIRDEMLHEIRYGPRAAAPEGPAAEILNAAALAPSDGVVRLNLGCGHLPLHGFANVDRRRLPGVDVVAEAADLPVEPGTVDEIFSAHMIEHFPIEELKRRLMPYWFSVLRPGGTFRAVTPDVGAMIDDFVHGGTSFETLHEVVYGGQEYEGDFHFVGFTTTSVVRLLKETGFVDVQITAERRRNGDCLELEVRAVRPAD